MTHDSTTQTPAATGRPTHEEISERAQELWKQYGCPGGRDEEIWLEAERQLLATNPALSGPPVVDQEEPVSAERARVLAPQQNTPEPPSTEAPVAQPATNGAPAGRSPGRATKSRRPV